MTLGEVGDAGGTSNSYKEDTSLEDRLALEAEEEKKYENGEGYGGGENWNDGVGGGKGANWASNIRQQDVAEVRTETCAVLPHEHKLKWCTSGLALLPVPPDSSHDRNRKRIG